MHAMHATTYPQSSTCQPHTHLYMNSETKHPSFHDSLGLECEGGSFSMAVAKMLVRRNLA